MKQSKAASLHKLIARLVFVVVIAAAWETAYRLELFPKLMFPSLESIFKGLWNGFASDHLMDNVLYSLTLIGKGLFIGIVLAFVLSSLSILSKTVGYIYEMLVSLFDLIPGVAMIPLAILWLGIGEAPIIFIVVHSVLWPMSRSIIDGFKAVPGIYLESGRNMGLNGWQIVWHVYLPASFAYLLSGIKIGWARAWRGLISAEMIFGTTSKGAGIGWFIFIKRVNIDIAGVFAALLVIVLIGIIVEYLVFNTIEKQTVKKWGYVK